MEPVYEMAANLHFVSDKSEHIVRSQIQTVHLVYASPIATYYSQIIAGLV